MRLNVLGGSYDDENKAFSPQRSINCHLRITELPGSRTEAVLSACYGVTEFSSLVALTGPLRALKRHKGDGTLYAVVGSEFVEVSADGTYTTRGTLQTTSGRIHMIDGGQTSTDNQLLILDGKRSYVWDNVTSTLSTNSLTTLPSAITGTYLDGYYIVNQARNSDTFEISALNDATSWAAEQSREAAEADPIVRVITSHGELWVFGSSTIKIWTNTGNIDFPFENLEGSLIERGLAGEYAIVSEDNTLFWLADDGIVYRANGYTPQRVSNHTIEQAIFRMSELDRATARLHAHTEDGAKMITLQVPGCCTWQLNLATGVWHERESFGSTTWDYDHIEAAYGKVLLGSTTSARIGYLDPDTFTEFGSILQYTRISGHIHAEQAPFIINRLEIVTEAGISDATGDGADAQIMTFISDTDGRSFGNPLRRNIGARGKYAHRCVMRQLGQHYAPVFKFVVTDPIRRSIIAVVADVEPLDI